MFNRYDTRRSRFSLSWRTKDNIKAGALVVLIGGGILAILAYTIWFHMNYVCIRSHVETQQQCDTTCWNNMNSGMSNCSTSCHPREVEVCDEYVPREQKWP